MNENLLPEKQVTEDSIPSRRGFVKSLLFELPAVSSNTSAGLVGVLSVFRNFIPNAMGSLVNAVNPGDAIIDLIDVNTVPIGKGEIIFVGIAHSPNRADDIAHRISGELHGEKLDRVFVELNLDQFLPRELRDRAENIDRSAGTFGVVSTISISNAILCHILKIKATDITLIKRRLLIMYILTSYNFFTPIDLFLNIFRLFGVQHIPPIGGYITTGRSVLMLIKCVEAARKGEKILYLCGKLHSDETKVLLENPQLFEILREVIPRVYGPIHTVGD